MKLSARKPVSVALVALIAATLSCGERTDTIGSGERSALPATETSLTLPPRPDGERTATPPVNSLAPDEVATPGPAPSPDPSAPMNRNDQSTPMGALCWARRQVVLMLVDSLSAANAPGDVAISADKSLDTIAQSNEIVLSVQRALPTEVQPFAARFEHDLASTQTQLRAGATLSETEASTAFQFEQYPAAKNYMRVATTTAECPDP